MNPTVTSAKLSVPVRSLPYGSFSGLWSGSKVNVMIKGKEYELESSIGLRGINIPCVVTITSSGVALATTTG